MHHICELLLALTYTDSLKKCGIPVLTTYCIQWCWSGTAAAAVAVVVVEVVHM